MKKHLGDILIEKGYLSSKDLSRALDYQMRKVFDGESVDSATGFILDVARTKYNSRDEFYLGKILTGLKLLPENRLQEALEIQKAAPVDAPLSKLDALNRIIARMNSSYNLIDLLSQILVLAAQLVDAESASLTIHDHARDTLVIVMPTGPGAEAVRDREVPKDRGIVGWVFGNGRPVICNNTATDARFYAAIDAASGYTSRQILCVPLTVRDKRLGAIEAINKVGTTGQATRGFSEADQFLLEMFSAQAAIAIENTRLAISLAQAEDDIAVRASAVPEAQRAHAGSLVADSFLHEMQKSLVPLKGYAARLGEISEDERVQKYQSYVDREIGKLIAYGQHVSRYLDGTLSPALHPVMLRDMLRELESRIWVDCRTSGIAYSLEMKGEYTLGADQVLLIAAMENLFRNSRDAMPGGGSFSLSVQPAGKGRITIDVADTGSGIQAEPIERVFEPFYTHGRPHGAGLGLAIARAIVALHGGTLTAANRTDSPGAVFRIALPVD
jgi:signal transduction histidine kinase